MAVVDFALRAGWCAGGIAAAATAVEGEGRSRGKRGRASFQQFVQLHPRLIVNLDRNFLLGCDQRHCGRLKTMPGASRPDGVPPGRDHSLVRTFAAPLGLPRGEAPSHHNSRCNCSQVLHATFLSASRTPSVSVPSVRGGMLVRVRLTPTTTRTLHRAYDLPYGCRQAVITPRVSFFPAS